MVLFGEDKGTIVSASAGKITVKAPAGAGYNHISVLNTSTGLRATSGGFFTLAFDSSDPFTGSALETSSILNIPNTEVAEMLLKDFNGDGKPDLVIGNYFAGKISIRFNNMSVSNADDTFNGDVITFDIPSLAIKIMTEDMDGDGKPDIEVFTFNGKIHILKNTSTGTGAPTFEPVDIVLNTIVEAVAIADMNNDGKPDILTSVDKGLGIIKNNCTPGIITPALFETAASITSTYIGGGIKVADINGDNRLDVVAGSDNKIIIFENHVTNGVLNNECMVAKYPFVVEGLSNFIVADVNADTRADIVCFARTSETNTIHIYKNNIDAGATITPLSFALQTKLFIPDGTSSLSASDIDGDGRVDIIASSTKKTVSIFKNAFNGTTPAAPWFDKEIRIGIPGSTKFIIGDCNNDSRPDLLIGSSGQINIIINKEPLIPVISSFSPLRGAAGSTLTIKGKYLMMGNTPSKVFIGGREATVTQASDTLFKVTVPIGTATGPVSILNTREHRIINANGNFSATFKAPANIERQDFRFSKMKLTGEYADLIQFRDFDGDGFLDLFYLDAGTAVVQRNSGKKKGIDCTTFEEPIKLNAPNNEKRIGFLSDINYDGLTDIIAGPNSFLNKSTKGKLLFEATEQFAPQLPHDLIIDVDGDGRADFSDYGNIYRSIYPKNATSVYAYEPVYLKLLPNCTFMDMNGDGKPDLVWTRQSFTDYGLVMYKNDNVPGSFSDSAFTAVTVPTNTEYATIADFDNDNMPDLYSQGKLYKNVTPIGGTFKFDAPIDIQYNKDDVYADVNGDGLPDLIRQKSGKFPEDPDTLLIFQNRAKAGQPFKFTTPVLFPQSDNFDSGTYFLTNFLGVQDLNNDNKPEIIFYDHELNELRINENTMQISDGDKPPVITSFNPQTGSVNSQVVIEGERFDPAGSRVYFGNLLADIVSATNNRITVKVPAGALYKPIKVLNTTTKRYAISTQSFIPKIAGVDGKVFDASLLTQAPDMVNNLGFLLNYEVADMDGDGNQEIVIGDLLDISPFNRYAIDIYKSQTKDTYNNPINFAKAGNYRSYIYSGILKVSDLDGDGKIDVLSPENDGLTILENQYEAGCGYNLKRVALIGRGEYDADFNYIIADLNNDGKPEIISGSGKPNELNIYYNNSKRGSISFSPFNNIKLNRYNKLGLYYFSIDNMMIADIDGDGWNDILFNDITTDVNKKVLFYMRNLADPLKSSATFAEPVELNKKGGEKIFWADLDNDKKDELIVKQRYNVLIYKNNSVPGTAAITELMELPLNAETLIDVADFDGDGKPDLLVDNIDTLTILRNTITAGVFNREAFSKRQSYKVGDHSSVQVIDYNKDGYPDISYLVRDRKPTGNIYTLKLLSSNSGQPEEPAEELPVTNFNVSVSSETCKNSNNGSISITAVKPLNYTATINTNDTTLLAKFTTAVTINNLQAGTYPMCITIDGNTKFQQCYNLVITEPKDLSVFAVADKATNILSLKMEGGTQYQVQLNGITYTNTTGDMLLSLQKGNNEVSVTTDKECQGVFKKTFNVVGDVSFYPNPFTDVLKIALNGYSAPLVGIEVRDLQGKVFFENNVINNNGSAEVNLAKLSAGVYVIKVSFDKTSKTYKIVKK
ncbi:hypothetical protein GCM10023149_18680 [Mucilaginibacter gynuensis]|uniref:IPT/TIG domain-containing protein n=2 Tax=Mucilaginibacter gynuensis TaxID=1302236 RepID=A0ABP8G9K6_9SPHI